MVSSQIFKRYPQTNHYLLSPSLFPGFMEYEPTMISFLSFCSYVSCASPASPSCSSQVMPNPDTPLLKVLQKWKLLKLNESSMGLITVFCVYMIKFFHGKKIKKKKDPDPLKAFHLKSPSLYNSVQPLGHVKPLSLCSCSLLLLGSHITCCQLSFHLRASALAVSSA